MQCIKLFKKNIGQIQLNYYSPNVKQHSVNFYALSDEI